MDDLAVALGATPVSAVSGEGIRESLHAIADLVEEAERIAPQRKGYVLHRPLGPVHRASRRGGWRIEGLAAERAVAFADLTLPEAADMAPGAYPDLVWIRRCWRRVRSRATR